MKYVLVFSRALRYDNLDFYLVPNFERADLRNIAPNLMGTKLLTDVRVRLTDISAVRNFAVGVTGAVFTFLGAPSNNLRIRRSFEPYNIRLSLWCFSC